MLPGRPLCGHLRRQREDHRRMGNPSAGRQAQLLRVLRSRGRRRRSGVAQLQPLLALHLTNDGGSVNKADNGFAWVAGTNNGTIRDIAVTDCTIACETGTTPLNVGGIAANNNGTVLRCTASGAISAGAGRHQNPEDTVRPPTATRPTNSPAAESRPTTMPRASSINASTTPRSPP